MNHRSSTALVLIASGVVLGCGSSGDGNQPGAGGASNAGGATGTGGTASGCVNLRVDNVLGRCTVTIGGTVAFDDPTHSGCIQPGVVTLKAKANPGSVLAMPPASTWHGTDDDTGTTTTTLSGASNSTSITVGGSVCVWACCPLADGSGCTGVTPAPCQ